MRHADLRSPGHAGLDVPLQQALEGMAPDSSWRVSGVTPNGCVAKTYTLLFALFPGEEAIGCIVGVQQPLVNAYGLRGQV